MKLMIDSMLRLVIGLSFSTILNLKRSFSCPNKFCMSFLMVDWYPDLHFFTPICLSKSNSHLPKIFFLFQ